MKTKVKSTPIIASEGLEQSVMGMDNHGRDMATYFLRDKIYSNKIKAVVREYICNAVDEHNKYGVDRPVEVSLTGDGIDRSIFSVRDYAEGLSDDGVRKIFGMYFRSTKSETNDSIGGFGVGSKAGHAYTDTFNIISHHNGVKTSYSCMLGAGDNNVPVGHIYKLDSCPTDETGIEINLEVKPIKERESRYSAREVSDSDKFKREIIEFVQFAHSPITANIFDTVYNTPEQKHTTTIDGFTISIVDMFTEEKKRTYNDEKFTQNIVDCNFSFNPVLKMGDVTYGNATAIKGASIKDHTAITITAPVGSIDIPISREGMEETERNNRLIERASEALKSLAEKDAEPFKKKTLIELTDDYIQNLADKREEGKYFKFSPWFVYAEYYEIASSIRDHTHSSLKTKIKDIDKEDDKPVVVVIPKNRATDTWISKVKTWCELNDKKYLCVREDADMGLLNASFTVKQARNLKFPKKGGKQNCAVVWFNARNIGTFTALQFHNKVRKDNDLKLAKDLAEAKKQNAKIAKSSEDVNLMRDLVLAKTKSTNSYYSRGVRHTHFVAAKGLLKDLKEIGIHQADCFGAISNRLKKVMEEKELKNNAKNFAENLEQCEWLSDRTYKILKKNPEKSHRIVALFDKIWQEDSLRSTILKKFVNLKHYWGGQRELTKEDMKRILKLK